MDGPGQLTNVLHGRSPRKGCLQGYSSRSDRAEGKIACVGFRLGSERVVSGFCISWITIIACPMILSGWRELQLLVGGDYKRDMNDRLTEAAS